MSKEVGGNLKGLAPSERKALARLYQRRVSKSELVSLDLARELCDLSAEIGRRIGLLISRQGKVVEVFVGTKQLLYLPDLGRYRLGRSRLRRLRLLYADLAESNETPQIGADVYTDLMRLRLDVIMAVAARKNQIALSYAYLIPSQERKEFEPVAAQTESVRDLGRFRFDFQQFIEQLDDELANSFSASFETGKTQAVLVGVYEASRRQADASLAELGELAKTAGVQVVGTLTQRRRPDPKTLLGKGKLEELILYALGVGAEMIIFDTELRPSQWRSITKSTELKVLDRSMLILDIFAQHAKSADGRIQVELAQLRYNFSRLTEMDEGLSRLTGGIGGRGPGETKLQVGRRRTRDRIAELERRIKKLGQQRGLRRKKRQGQELPVVAILGYTNVGKSTLFNGLTASAVLSEDKLFATLDPSHRRLRFPNRDNKDLARNRAIVLTDTVGFIRELPKELVNAFKATLEVLEEADCLIHVLDAADPDLLSKQAAVDKILDEMNLAQVPVVLVLNKSDLVSEERAEELQRETGAVLVSAIEGRGLNQVLERVEWELYPEVRESVS